MENEFTCELDGYVMHAETDDELAATIDRHIAEAHPELVGKVSGESLLADRRAPVDGA